MTTEDINLKLCAKCKNMIPKSTKGWYCDKCRKINNREYNKYNNKNIKEKVNKVYNSSKWRKTRDKIRRSNAFCEVCKELNIQGVLAEEVHHIVKVKYGDESTHYDPNNLISVCSRHHKLIEGMSKEKLIEALQDGSLL